MNLKLFVAIVPPQRLEAVQGVIELCHARKISIARVVSEDDEDVRIGTYRGTNFRIHPSRYRVEYAIPESDVETVIAAINSLEHTTEVAQTGRIKMVVLPMEASILPGVVGEVSQAADVTDGHESDEVQRLMLSDRRRGFNVPSKRAAVGV